MEPTKTQFDDLVLLVESGTDHQLRDFLKILHPADIADMLESIDERHWKKVFSVLTLKLSAEVIAEIEDPYKRDIVDRIVRERMMKRERLVAILREMESDDVADLLGIITTGEASRILSEMDIKEGAEISRLLRYPDDSAGGIMQTEMLAISSESTVDHAIEEIRAKRGKIADLHNIFVVGPNNRFMGVIPLQSLILATADTVVSEIMDTNVVTADVMMDQEEVARLFRKYDLISLPVVDSRNRLIGRIMVDDIVDVLDEEADEDFMKMAGSIEEDVSSLSPRRSVRARIPWLFVTFIGGALNATVIAWYSGELANMLLFIPFLPLILGMAGNVGNQSATIIVRGLATGKVDALKVWQVAAKEIWVGLIIGIIYGVLLGLLAGFIKIEGIKGIKVGLAVGVSLSLVVTLAAMLGALLPIIFHRMRVDPALATAPFISTSMDLLGATLYLSIALMLFS